MSFQCFQHLVRQRHDPRRSSHILTPQMLSSRGTFFVFINVGYLLVQFGILNKLRRGIHLMENDKRQNQLFAEVCKRFE
ncbi:hypothetical protein IC582_002707 [Cucumis melo]